MDSSRLIQPQNIFLVLALIYGISFLFIIPPFQIPDENSHFYKAFYVSEGYVTPEKNDFYFPKSIHDTMEEFTSLRSSPHNEHTLDNIFPLLNLPLNSNDRAFINISNIAIYPPIPYLASALIMNIGKLFDLSPLILMYSGRFINLIIWIVLVYFAIKITPVHRWVFLLLALMPMTLHQAASLSADSFTIGLSFLTIAFFFKLAFSEINIGSKEIVILILLIFTLALSKGYAILLLLFMIPIYKFKKGNKTRILTFASIGLITLTFTGLWNHIFRDSYIANPDPAISMSGQISFILQNPLEFFNVLFNTIIVHFKPYIITLVGDFGWLSIPLPEWMVYTYLGVLIFVALMDKSELKINPKQKLISIFTFLLTAFMVFLFEYATWTPIGQSLIEGVQGRYFIPVLPLFFLMFYNTKTSFKIYNKVFDLKLSKIAGLLITTFLIIFLSITFRIIIFKY